MNLFMKNIKMSVNTCILELISFRYPNILFQFDQNNLQDILGNTCLMQVIDDEYLGSRIIYLQL